MRRMALAAGVGIWVGIFCAAEAWAQKPPLLPEKDVAALANEISGEDGETESGRDCSVSPASAVRRDFMKRRNWWRSGCVRMVERCGDFAGFPADGTIFYGTQRSRPAWDAEKGELSEVKPGPPPVCDKEKIENGKLVFNSDCVDLGAVK